MSNVKAPSMKRASTVFLQVVIVLIGIGVLALMLWEPTIEGRNAHATLSQIYFNDPFLVYAYTASIAFFVALFQAFKLLEYVERNEVFSDSLVKALRIIQYCAMTLIVFIVGAETYFFIVVRGTDDIAGGAALGFVMIFISVVVAAAASIFEGIIQSVIGVMIEKDIKY